MKEVGLVLEMMMVVIGGCNKCGGALSPLVRRGEMRCLMCGKVFYSEVGRVGRVRSSPGSA